MTTLQVGMIPLKDTKMDKIIKPKKLCHSFEITIPDNREIIFTDRLKFPWCQDPKGYFLIKLENNQICCGFVDAKTHIMQIEFRGKDPFNMIKEIAKRDLTSTSEHMGYISSELMIAYDCLKNNKKYIQR